MLVSALAGSLALAQGGFAGPGQYEIANLQSGKVLDLDRNDQTTVIQYSSRGTDNQRWTIERADGGFWFIRNGMNGKALEATRNANSAPVIGGRFNGGPGQQWRIEPGKDGNALIVSSWGRTLDIPDGSNRDGLHVQIYDLNGDSNQRFILRRVGGAVFGGRDPDRDRDRDRDRDDRGRGGPDPSGKYWDDRDQMFKLAGNGVCFYREPDFRGEALCTRSGSDIGDTGRVVFGSVRLFGRAQVVEVFERQGFRGDRMRITRDMRDLERMGGRVGSFRVQ